MPRSQNYLLQSRSPSPPSPLTDLASPTIETAPPSPIEAQSQLCECNTQWQHDFFGCAYSLFPFPSAQPSSFPPSSSGLVGSWARWKLPCMLLSFQLSSTIPPSKNGRHANHLPGPFYPTSRLSDFSPSLAEGGSTWTSRHNIWARHLKTCLIPLSSLQNVPILPLVLENFKNTDSNDRYQPR
jgi:hypothetical protein